MKNQKRQRSWQDNKPKQPKIHHLNCKREDWSLTSIILSNILPCIYVCVTFIYSFCDKLISPTEWKYYNIDLKVRGSTSKFSYLVELKKMTNSSLLNSVHAGAMQNYDANRRHHDRDFWRARRAFLKSYNFSDEYGRDEGLKGKMKKSMKELNRSASRVVGGICEDMAKRKLGIRVYRLTIGMPSMVLVTMRCFMPSFRNKETTHF